MEGFAMSEVFHSAGVPGATRCSESATGTEARIPAGDPQRLAVAHDCACEIDGLARLALAIRQTPHDDNPLVLRGLLLRILALTDVQVSMLGSEPLLPFDLQALRDTAQGVETPLQGVGQ